MNIGIVDDQKVFRQMIRDYLSEYFSEASYTYQTYDYEDGRELIESKVIHDILFLDIEMEGVDGMQVAQYLRKQGDEVYIIFMTSHHEVMQEAFKVKAFRFLIKPVTYDAFKESMDDLIKDMFRYKKIHIKYGDKEHLLSFKEIQAIESLGDTSLIHTKSRQIESNRTLAFWEETLQQGAFFRIHKSVIINLNHVKHIEKSRVFTSSGVFPVARRRLSMLKKAMVRMGIDL